MEIDGERALTFALGLLITIGTFIFVLYTSSGLALLPVGFIKSAPSLSNPSFSVTTASRLEENLERQRQLEGRCGGNLDNLGSKDRREFDSLTREERTLRRRQRLAEEANGERRGLILKAWYKVAAVLRPLKFLGGLILLFVSILTWVSMLLTCIDKVSNSVCQRHCGFILGKVNIFNPFNWLFVQSAKFFPVDYGLFIFLVLFFFGSSVVGMASIGIRFLWVRVFQIRKGHTSPQALLLATILLTLITLALNYSISMIVAPQYATYGSQTFCDTISYIPFKHPDCTHHPELIKPCSETAQKVSAKVICTPSVVSTFLNRIALNFPFFTIVDYWSQFVFLGKCRQIWL